MLVWPFGRTDKSVTVVGNRLCSSTAGIGADVPGCNQTGLMLCECQPQHTAALLIIL